MAGRLLIHSAIATNRIILRCKLSAACYEVLQTATSELFLEAARNRAPDLILIETGGDPDAELEKCRALKSSADTANCPILMLTTVPDEGFRSRALRAGADEVFDKPLHDELLLASLRNLIRQRRLMESLASQCDDDLNPSMAEEAPTWSARSKIYVVSSTAEKARAWAGSLRERMKSDIRPISAAEALKAGSQHAFPDVFILSNDVGRKRGGLNLLSELRSRTGNETPGFVMIMEDRCDSSDARACDTAMALDLGADEVLQSGFSAEELSLRIHRQLERKSRRDAVHNSVRAGLRLALRDPLTGLHNRRYGLPRLEQMLATARVHNKTVCAMILDIDRFKVVNDTYGHAAGDAVLCEVAKRLREVCGENTLLSRQGGEEFLVAMPGIDAGEARQFAHALQSAVSTKPIQAEGSCIRITMSIGVAVASASALEDTRGATLLRDADAALYTAKAEGRDQITLARPAA